MTRCQEVSAAMANGIQQLWLLHVKLAKKLEAREPIARAEIDEIDFHANAMAEALRRCR